GLEPRQTSTTANCHQNHSKSIKLSPALQRLVDDVTALCSRQPTVERVLKRHSLDCVYNDQIAYANNQESKNQGYELIRNEQVRTRCIPITAIINALIKHCTDQANDTEHSHEGLSFSFKKWQANNVVNHQFEAFKEHQRVAAEGVKLPATVGRDSWWV
ncbi:hypothetical protein EV363DRAFT_1178577, partial [Boletus edulis]